MSTSPPGSPLSEMSSEEFVDDAKSDGRSMSLDIIQHDPESTSSTINAQRPAKRLKLTTNSIKENPPAVIPQMPMEDAEPYVSSDTDGSVPASPTHPNAPNDEDSLGADQITVCKWEGCEGGDLGNMDNLVTHLHDEHIDKSSRGQAPPGQGSQAKKYSCEWVDCARKGIPHASGYALRAHMRSHTREKPFYCALPECDRAFTRSDALAKHMRTVHETEALRPSDPVPKHHSSHAKLTSSGVISTPTTGGRIKLVFNKGANGDATGEKSNTSTPVPNQADGEPDPNNNVTYVRGPSGDPDDLQPQFPPDIHFTAEELALPAADLFRLLRRQLHWAQEESGTLKQAIEDLEVQRKKEFFEKELILENVMEAESVIIERKSIPTGPDGAYVRSRIKEDVKPAKGLQMQGLRTPWWREGDGKRAPLLDGGAGKDVDMDS